MIQLRVEAVAHGGHCVARSDGRVVFVRHTLPGETVRAEVTGEGGGGRYLFADAVEVLTASPQRREAPCPVSGPGGCGGCDWQHVEPAAQRQLKATVLAEQLQRLGGVDVPVEVRSIPGDADGLDWRTRVRYAVAPDGRLGFRKHRSHDVQPVPFCVIATPDVRAAAAPTGDWRPAREVDVVTAEGGVVVSTRPGDPPAGTVTRTAAGRRWEIPADGFWQVHPGAPDALVDAVADGIGTTGEVLWDLYAGVGLFAGALGGGWSQVHAVESSRAAVACARRNLADTPAIRVHRADVARWLHDRPADARRVSAVVLDPPRRGAGRAVTAGLTDTAATRLAYVACDPAALGRDVGEFRRDGWQLESVVGFDLFPNTHHVEAVAVLSR